MYTMASFDQPDVDGHRYWFDINNVDAPAEDCLEVYNWVVERFGEREPRYDEDGNPLRPRWMGDQGAGSFWFREDNDAFEFRMRWC